MNHIILKSGKEFDCSFTGVASAGVLYIIVENTTAADVAQYFSDKNETSVMNYKINDGDSEIVYENYTVFLLMVPQGDGFRIGLRRPYVGE